MTSSYAPSTYGTDIVTGQAITNMIATILNQAAANQNALYQTAGYYDPYSLGGGSYAPTLQRELGFAGLGLDRELGYGNLQLGQDSLNYNQRLGERGLQLDALGLLSSQRGPENYLAYNYLLNSMGTPEGMPADITQFTKGLYQPSNAVGTARSERATPEATVPHQKPVASSTSAGPQTSGNTTYTSKKTGGTIGTSYTTLADGTKLVVDQERFDTDPNYLKLIEQAVTTGKKVPGLAQGGQTSAPLIQVGDSPSGAPTGNEEVVANPTGAPIAVLPNEAVQGMNPTAESPPDPVEVLQMISALIQSVMGGQQGDGQMPGGQMPGQPAVRAASGGMFGGTVYSPDVIAAAPAVQKFLGGGRLFGGTKLNTTLPGTETNLGSTFNLRNFQNLLPSEQDFVQGLYEATPEQGGLGVDFRDILAQSYRAAPVGARFGASAYG